MMRMAAGLACVGIRGADIEIVRQFLSKRSFRELVILRLIVVAVGGNTLAKKINGKQEPNKTAVETRESLQSLVRHVKTLAPNAIIITLDLIPRSSRGFFNCRARVIARNMIQQGPYHHHAEFLDGFLICSRVNASESYRPKDLLYDGGDGVHPNVFGYEALTKITDWLLEQERSAGDAYTFAVCGHSLTVKMKF